MPVPFSTLLRPLRYSHTSLNRRTCIPTNKNEASSPAFNPACWVDGCSGVRRADACLISVRTTLLGDIPTSGHSRFFRSVICYRTLKTDEIAEAELVLFSRGNLFHGMKVCITVVQFPFNLQCYVLTNLVYVLLQVEYSRAMNQNWSLLPF
jgi:hypothetical protein